MSGNEFAKKLFIPLLREYRETGKENKSNLINSERGIVEGNEVMGRRQLPRPFAAMLRRG